MKKLILFAAAVVLSLQLNAQHVTPLQIALVEFDLPSLRAEYTEPAAYLAQLQHIQLDQKANDERLKYVEKELKEEQAHLKSLIVCVKETSSTLNDLEKQYKNEKKTLEALNKTYDKQSEAARKSTRLDEESRERFLNFLSDRQKIIKDALRDVSQRLKNVDNERPGITRGEQMLKDFEQEILKKELDLKQLKESHKIRVETVKAEVKMVENQIKEAKKAK